jgi:hypothetical protein
VSESEKLLYEAERRILAHERDCQSCYFPEMGTFPAVPVEDLKRVLREMTAERRRRQA